MVLIKIFKFFDGDGMEIRNLVTFVRIAETQNFSRTAEQLGYSQSAVTMQIKQLEGELRTQLFERIGKQVKLTQAGERLLPYALEILKAVRQAEEIAREPAQIAGKLRIGTCESFVISVLPPVLMELAAHCPQVEISTHTARIPELIQMLRRNDVDILYFLDQKMYFPEWVKVSERPEKIFFVASAASALAREKHIPVERLLQEPLYLTEKGDQLPVCNGAGFGGKRLRAASRMGGWQYRCDHPHFAEEQGRFFPAGICRASVCCGWAACSFGC